MPRTEENDFGPLTQGQRLALKHSEFLEFLQSPRVKMMKRYLEPNRFGGNMYVVEYDSGGSHGILRWPTAYQDGGDGRSDKGRKGKLTDLAF